MSSAPVLARDQRSDPVMDNHEQVPASCSRCGGTDLRATTMRSAFWDDDRLVVVEDIPAIVCQKCHEHYYEDMTVVLLDLLRGDGYPPEKALREITVPVFSLRDKKGGAGS
jgi:YgiT-type zinc finger domain-containing protein